MTPEVRTIANINGNDIFIIKNGDEFVPIKPICDILGIDVEGQRKKIKNDEILSDFLTLQKCKTKDNKMYNMSCLPIQYTIGWIMTLNPDRVKNASKENVLNKKKECYEILCKYVFE